MPSSPPPPPSARVSPLLHLKRALAWNLGRIAPSEREAAALAAAGVTDPAVQRYAVWRRSLLLAAAVPTLVAFVLAVLDATEQDFGELTMLGTGLEVLWLLAAAGLPAACLVGVRSWRRPGASSKLLLAAWTVTFILPFVYALLPVDALFHVRPIDVPADHPAIGAAADALGISAAVAAEHAAKLASLQQMAIEFVLSGGTYLLLLPAVLSLIPGAVNGCLRIKALLPAAQLPGWLLVCAAPIFLLFWLVILVIVNHAARSPLLVLGVTLWAGSPIWYALRGRVFVQSQISDEDAAKIARVKRATGAIALAGIGLMVAFIATTKVAGLHVVGLDREAALSTKLDELSAKDEEVSLDDVQAAFEGSTSFVYALDLSSFRLVVDFLAKLLLVTAVFADLVLRATLAAWRNDRSLRARAEASSYDASAAAAVAVLSPAAAPRP